MRERTGVAKVVITLNIILLSAFECFSAPVTEKADSLLRVGDELRAGYEFGASVSAYTRVLESLQDSTGTYSDSALVSVVNDRILLSENGRTMSGFVDSPVVVARHKFSLSDFFLYYPLEDKCWREVPNPLDSIPEHPFSKATYVPDGIDTIYYSAADQEGIRNIYRTECLDSVWTTPVLLNEQMTSASDEIYPMLSPDGKNLYFASAGLYGVGGYDLYVSTWNEETSDWGTPVNMGFPYSSPADDFLLVNTDDGRYTVFASNRDCGKDSVYVYVLEYDSMPVRKAVDSPEELLSLSRLEPSEPEVGDVRLADADIPENVDTRKYMEQMSQVKALRDTLSVYENLMEDDRNRYVMSTDADERIMLTNRILKTEAMLPSIRDSLSLATERLRKTEMEFLFSGVVIDPEKLMEAADREVVGESTEYAFVKMKPGIPLQMNIMPPPVEFDYTFKVLDEGCFALDNTLPDGIIYQIQIFSLGRKATVKNLRGLTPVFEQETSNGRFIYRVGLFKSYKDVLSKLNTVKKAGFKSAFIVAFDGGVEIAVSKARTHEKQRSEKPVFYNVRIVPEAGELDESAAVGINQQAGGKDIARITEEDGSTAYIVGPFSDKGAAESLETFVKAMGIGKCEITR